jgi:glycerate kinase
MARASGLELLQENERNCLLTSSFGTGELIAHALNLGAETLTLTVGGTATNDAGIGMAVALGYRFFDENNAQVVPIGRNLGQIVSIDSSGVHPRLAGLKTTVVTDVTSPFFGPEGAVQLYGPQKGADAAGVKLLNTGMEKLAAVLENYFGKAIQQIPGSGAGGGMGGGAICFLGADTGSGADWVLRHCDLPAKLAWADVLITGEGKIDYQSTQGKLLSRLLNQALEAQTPAILVCGTLAAIDPLIAHPAVKYAVSILNQPMPLAQALKETRNLLEQQGALLGKWLK